MLRYAFSALLLGLAVAGPAATRQSDAAPEDPGLTKLLTGLVPGKPTRCLDHSRVTEVRGFEGTIVYLQGRKHLWRNTTVGACPGLARGDLIVTRGITSQYCQGDSVETRARPGGQITGVCSLGQFVPYAPPAAQ